MKTFIVKPEISHFSSASTYSESGKSLGVLYLGSNIDITRQEFAEYDFTNFINKFKYNGDKLIDFADQELTDLAGTVAERLDVLNSLVFPTNSPDSGAVKKDKFFGSLNIKGTDTTLYLLYADEGVKSIELFENLDATVDKFDLNLIDSEDLNYSTTLPCLVLELGPEEGKIYSDTKELAKLEDEVRCSKVIWLTTSFDSASTSYNLSYGIWLSESNSQRNKNKYSIRNDEYLSTVNHMNSVEELSSGLFVDGATGVILGTDCVETSNISHPLLTLVNSHSSKNTFSINVSYSKGEEVLFNNTTYTSLVDNNLGNIPSLSTQWVSNASEKFLTTRIDILTDPLNTAVITPSKLSINNTADSGPAQVSILPVAGYEVDFDFETRTGQCISNGYDYTTAPNTLSRIDDPTNIYVKTFLLGLGTDTVAWSNFIKSESGKVIIKMKKKNTDFRILLKDVQGNQYFYNQWVSYIKGESDFGVKRVELDNAEVAVNISSDSILQLPVKEGSIIKIFFGKLSRYEIDSITLTTYDGVNNEVLNVPVKWDPIYGYYVEGEVDYLFAEYVLNVSTMTYTIGVYGDLKYYEIEDKFLDSDYNQEFNARFYRAANNTEPGKGFYSVLIYRESDNFTTPVELREVGDTAVIGEGANAVKLTLLGNSQDGVFTVHGDKTCENYRINIIKNKR